ncbi:MAG: hypothetical protein HC806_03165, partial [Anaerolineae bacterium]|nr:hypothetical protein [Anaerolineae bacterium]
HFFISRLDITAGFEAIVGEGMDSILLAPEDYFFHHKQVEARWEAFYEGEEVFRELEAVGKYSEVHLDIIGEDYTPEERDTTSGPDAFEIGIGNHLVYSVPLFEQGNALNQLKSNWLPYYDENLRQERLAEARMYCLDNLHHIPIYAPRGD